MLKTTLLHPELLHALARAGHGARVLIADGNYPFSTGAAPGAARVYLNLAPGLVGATDVLRVLAAAIPIEAALVMVPADGAPQPIFREFRKLLPPGLELTRRKRFEFYNEARSPDVALVIATGEQRRFANLLLVIGVVKAPDDKQP